MSFIFQIQDLAWQNKIQKNPFGSKSTFTSEHGSFANEKYLKFFRCILFVILQDP